MHNKNSAMMFIVLLGVVSLFSDMTHEAATSIKGAYLLILGASASTIGFISGVGELLGYGLRYLFGHMVDKIRTKALIISTAISVFFALLAFGNSSPEMVMLGVTLWGVGMGAQESIMKAAVATMTSKEHRASSYGAFEFFFGLSWFLGSWALGAIYDYSLTAFVAISVAAQLVALPCYLASERSFAHGA